MHPKRRSFPILPLVLWTFAAGAGTYRAAAAGAPAAASPAPAGELRLGTDVVPTAEGLELQLDPGSPSYRGTARIALRVARAAAKIRFHAEKMTLESVALTQPGGGVVQLEPRALADGVVELTPPRKLAPGDYTLSVGFHNDFDAHSVGIYRVTQGDKSYVFSQLESADARHSFPCFDEPGFKIPWHLQLVVPAGMTGATNAPLASESKSPTGDSRVLDFAPTPPLPSYLVAVAVGPFDVVDLPGLSVPGRILAPAGEGKLTGMAVEMTPKLLAGLETWFGQPYPFAKLDLVAVPEFWPGAMENPGLITFADRILLAPAGGAGANDRRSFAAVVTHEMSHMWFGDLVTMQWWDDLWLNESFADWLGYRVSDQAYPGLGIATEAQSEGQAILAADARPSTPAVRQPVARAGDALGNVGIAYAKGSAVLRMVERWLGPETFRHGVQSYLAAHARGNATGADLWSALGRASDRDVAAVMTGFLDQPGYPLLSFEVTDPAKGTVTVTQRRFHAPGVEVKPEHWQVPVLVKWSDGTTVRTQDLLLTGERQQVTLGGPIAWLAPNPGAAGYYLWKLPAAAQTELAAHGPERLDVSERVGLLGNAGGLLDGGLLAGDAYLRIVGAAVADPDPAVVGTALDGLDRAERAFVPDAQREPFAAYVRRTVGPTLERIGRLPREGESQAVTLLRPQLLTWLGIEGRDADVRAYATAQADAYLARPEAVPGDLVATVLRLSALGGDAARFDTYRQRFEGAKDPTERRRFLSALGAFARPELREKALAYVLTGPLRDNELTVISRSNVDDAGADRAFAWLRENWKQLAARTPPELLPFLVGYAGGCSAERMAVGKTFFAAPDRRTPALDARLKRAGEQVAQCVALRQNEGATVAAFLAATPPGAPAPAAAAGAPISPAPAAAPLQSRLGDAVVPTAERLTLRLDPSRTDYTGRAEITLLVRAPVPSFRFHAEAMRVGAVTLQAVAGGETLTLQAAPPVDDLVEVTAPRPLAPGSYRLRVDFANDFGTQAAGLYRAVVAKQGYLFTDFEPTQARQAFPCWDEPSFKIPWQVTLTVPAGLVAAANSPVEKTTTSEPGWQTVVFAETPPLPSYLVAFVVGPFDVVEMPGLSVPGRILTVAGAGKLAGMARGMTPALLTALESWFGQRYPFAKLDLVAVPEYSAGAMENPGLITFLDRVLLASVPESLDQRKRFADVTTHELSHMWFGDLVTMRWWDDLWLNEGFADWLGPKVADQVHPEFGIALDSVRSLGGTMAGDARPSAPAVRRPVTRAKDVFTDAGLAYAKGRAVLAMVEQWLGPETFRRGVRAYVAEHQRGNATASDLWRALAQASGQDVAGVMGSFLDQPGNPLLDVTVVDPARGVVEITQRRFLDLGDEAPAEHWQVPLVLKWSDGKRVQTRPFLLTAERQRFELGGPVVWLFPNAGGRGYYRWRLPPAALTELAAKAGERLDGRERIALLGNVSGLLDGGALAGDDYLRVLAATATDPDPQVLETTIGALGKAKDTFVTAALREPFAAFVRRTLGPALTRIGSLPRAGEPVAAGLLRPTLLDWLGDEGRDPAVRDLARGLAHRYLERPAEVDSELASVALDLSALDGDAALFDTYRQRFEAAQDPEERVRFLSALGRFTRPELADRALAYALTGPLRPQEIRTVAASAAAADDGFDRVFAWVRASWPALLTRLPPDRVPALTRFAGGCSSERLAAGRAFFGAPERRTPAIDTQLARVGDQVAECVALRRQQGGAVASFLTAPAGGAAARTGG